MPSAARAAASASGNCFSMYCARLRFACAKTEEGSNAIFLAALSGEAREVAAKAIAALGNDTGGEQAYEDSGQWDGDEAI